MTTSPIFPYRLENVDVPTRRCPPAGLLYCLSCCDMPNCLLRNKNMASCKRLKLGDFLKRGQNFREKVEIYYCYAYTQSLHAMFFYIVVATGGNAAIREKMMNRSTPKVRVLMLLPSSE